MANWLRFRHGTETYFGTLEGELITVYEGDLFDNPRPTEQTQSLDNVEILIPCHPSKMVGLWNNVRSAAAKQGWAIPEEPLSFIKPPSCYLPHMGIIRKPNSYSGRVVYEGELAIVIGRQCANITVEESVDVIFGYTCANDVTAFQLINQDESFQQWSRAKGFDTFGVFGPTIKTDISTDELMVKTVLNGRVRQDYPVSDFVFSPAEIVAAISRDTTLFPGDVILCGTGNGVLPMKPGSKVEIVIEGIGTLANTFEA